MPSTIHERVAPGIYRLQSGSFRVRVAVGDRGHGGRQRETTFPSDAGLRAMRAWQTHTRATLLRQGLVPVRGTLEADVPTYLTKMQRTLAFADSREDEINAWLVRFGKRKRHTITRDEVRRQIRDWEDDGFAASTIRHRMTALSTLYDALDGDDAYKPVKGVRRPTEAEPTPDARPPHVIISVLDELWLRAGMNNRGWKTLARALVLAHTGMRPSQMMRLDPDLHIRPYLDEVVAMVEVPSGKGGKHTGSRSPRTGLQPSDCSCASARTAGSRLRRSTSRGSWPVTPRASRVSTRTSCGTPTRRSSGALERTSPASRSCSDTSRRRRHSDTPWSCRRSSSRQRCGWNGHGPTHACNVDTRRPKTAGRHAVDSRDGKVRRAPRSTPKRPRIALEPAVSSDRVITVKVTAYFEAIRTRADRAVIREEWIERAMREPIREHVQADGRIRRWTQVTEMDSRYLRVVLLPDGETVHNAFFDRGFKP